MSYFKNNISPCTSQDLTPIEENRKLSSEDEKCEVFSLRNLELIVEKVILLF